MSRGLNVFVNIGGKLLPSLNSAAGAVEKRFGLMSKRIRLHAAETKAAWKGMAAAASPLMGMAAAGGLMMTAEKAIGKSAHLTHELQMLRNAGRTTREISAAMAEANRTIKLLPTTTLEDNLKVLNETTGAFGSFQHALENLTFNQRVGSMLQNVLGDKAGEPGDIFQNMVRAMEMRGAAQDHHRYQKEVAELYKAMTFTGGRFNAEEFLNYSQQANPYTKGMSLRFLSKIAPSLIQEFGGDRAGTMQNTWMGTILGKAKNKISTEAWMKLGLLDPKQVVYNKVGPVGWRPGAIKDTNLAMSDPLAWSEKVLIPALKAQGVNTGNQLDLAKALMPLFRDRNANRLANALVNDLDRKRLHKDEGLINKVPGVDKAYDDTLRRDPLMAWTAVKSSFSNMLATMFGGKEGENGVAIALVNIAKGINMVAGAFQAAPWLGKGVGALLLGATGLATLRMFGMGLRFAFGPLMMVGRGLAFMAGKFMPLQWAMVRARYGMLGLVRLIGGQLFGGLARLGPLLIRGLVMAFGMLSNPVGWAIMAVIAAAAIYRFRHEIAAFWSNTVVPWFKNAWQSIVATAKSINWASVGMSIADSLTFGLASKFAAGLGRLASAAKNAVSGPANAKPAGARANGGPVLRNRLYMTGERGRELFVPGTSGRIVPNHHVEAMARRRPNAGNAFARGGNAPLVGTLVVQGGQGTPAEIEAAVGRALKRLANGQAALLSD